MNVPVASVAFPFRSGDLSSVMSLVGAFAASSDDASVSVDVEGSVWAIDPARGRLVYTPTDVAKSGRYAVSLTAQNQSRAGATALFEICVANRVCDRCGQIRHRNRFPREGCHILRLVFVRADTR